MNPRFDRMTKNRLVITRRGLSIFVDANTIVKGHFIVTIWKGEQRPTVAIVVSVFDVIKLWRSL